MTTVALNKQLDRGETLGSLMPSRAGEGALALEYDAEEDVELDDLSPSTLSLGSIDMGDLSPSAG